MADIIWKVTPAVWDRWKHLYDQLQGLPETSDAYRTIAEEMRLLPNFPHHYDEDLDTIVPILASTDYIQVA